LGIGDNVLDDWGLTPGKGWEVFSSILWPDWLWSPPNLLTNGYQGFLT